MNSLSLGYAIKLFRTQKGFTQLDLGNAVGFDSKTISRFETGNYPPSLETVYKIADFLRVPVIEFFREYEADENEKRAFLLNIICKADKEELDRLIMVVNKSAKPKSE